MLIACDPTEPDVTLTPYTPPRTSRTHEKHESVLSLPMLGRPARREPLRRGLRLAQRLARNHRRPQPPAGGLSVVTGAGWVDLGQNGIGYELLVGTGGYNIPVVVSGALNSPKTGIDGQKFLKANWLRNGVTIKLIKNL